MALQCPPASVLPAAFVLLFAAEVSVEAAVVAAVDAFCVLQTSCHGDGFHKHSSRRRTIFEVACLAVVALQGAQQWTLLENDHILVAGKGVAEETQVIP